ncbi:MAG: PKD domain-containing protein [Chloroflexi bacterium]|nr:PKD domain-containing protein [Chloroflexota bacterium]
MTVTFTDFSTGEINEWEWDFNGDGIIESVYYQRTNPDYTYPAVNNTYAVTLTVTGPGDVISTRTRHIEVTGCS